VSARNGAADGRQPASRSRRSARNAGTWFERSVADYLAATMTALTGWPSGIDRRPKTGNKDRGDIGGVRRWTLGRGTTPNRFSGKVVVECKYEKTVKLAEWAREAEIERGNDDALAGVVVHKRHGVSDPARQWVPMELATLVALLAGERPEQLIAPDDSRDAVEALSGDAGRAESVSHAVVPITVSRTMFDDIPPDPIAVVAKAINDAEIANVNRTWNEAARVARFDHLQFADPADGADGS
jgi:hypothetical protein